MEKITMNQKPKRNKKLSEFVQDHTSNWRDDVDPTEVKRLTVYSSNAQASKIAIEEMSGDEKTTTLRIFNIMTYALYEPGEVLTFLVNEFPKECKMTGLDQMVADDFHDYDQEILLQNRREFASPKTVIDKNGAMVVLAETLMEIDDKAEDKNKVLRNYVQPHAHIVDNSNKYSITAGPIVEGGTATYRTNGRPPRLSPESTSVLNSDWE